MHHAGTTLYSFLVIAWGITVYYRILLPVYFSRMTDYNKCGKNRKCSVIGVRSQ